MTLVVNSEVSWEFNVIPNLIKYKKQKIANSSNTHSLQTHFIYGRMLRNMHFRMSSMRNASLYMTAFLSTTYIAREIELKLIK